MNSHTGDKNDIVQQVRHDIFRRLLPLIVCMIVLGVTGVVGNILAFIFYAFQSKRSTTVMLIACLAMVDLIVCILFIPNIIEMWVNVNYTASFMCKLAHFFGLWTVACSALILWVVSIDRHRKICYPFGKQWTLVTTKYAVIGIVGFGFALSVRNFANFDNVKVDIKDTDLNVTVYGHYCTSRDDAGYVVSVTVFTVIDFILMLTVWVTLVVAYSHIIYVLFKLKLSRKRRFRENVAFGINNNSYNADQQHTISTCRHEDPSSSLSISDTEIKEIENIAISPKKESLPGNSDMVCIIDTKIGLNNIGENKNPIVENNRQNLRCLENQISTSRPNDANTTDCPVDCPSSHTVHPENGDHLSSDTYSKYSLRTKFYRRKTSKRYKGAKCVEERNLTFKMLAVSIVFILCFTPYFIVKILMREVLQSGEEYELGILAQISIRLPYMNSVFNPIIYCVFNPQFRAYTKNLFTYLVSNCIDRIRT